jgi:hypothetical protein
MQWMRWTPIVGQSGALFEVERHWAVARETPTKGLARPRGGRDGSGSGHKAGHLTGSSVVHPNPLPRATFGVFCRAATSRHSCTA